MMEDNITIVILYARGIFQNGAGPIGDAREPVLCDWGLWRDDGRACRRRAPDPRWRVEGRDRRLSTATPQDCRPLTPPPSHRPLPDAVSECLGHGLPSRRRPQER